MESQPALTTSAPAESADERIFNVVLGTAGHIDHGKSTLVEALTGIHPDRLKEEQERGITIDIGFAPLKLSSGLRVGIIDVPGHEKFIKNMVAGATGIDFVMLVVAADDGVMAQTREHLQIIKLLGVPDGMTVITKIDLAEPGFADLVAEEIQELSVGTCLENKPVVHVSSKTGAGIDTLKATLEKQLAVLKRRSHEGPFRMNIQRVFAKEGFGTVVTGVPVSGSLGRGDHVDILPLGITGRVKGLHAYQHTIARARAGHSTAVNVTGIERLAVMRGMVAATPGIFKPTRLFSAHLVHLPDAPYPLKHRAPVRFHAGTVEVMGKVLLLDGDQLVPGAEGYLQVHLEEPVLLAPGDRYILRHQSPMVTLGGGQVLDVRHTKRKRQSVEVLEELAARRQALGDPQAFLELLLRYAAGPKRFEELGSEAGALPAQVEKWVAALKKNKLAVVLKQGEIAVGTNVFEGLAQRIADIMNAFFAEHPALSTMGRPELKSRLEAALLQVGLAEAPWFDELLNVLSSRGALKCEGNEVRLAGHERKLDARWASKAQQVEEALKAGALQPPELPDLEAVSGLKPKEFKDLLKYLLETKRIVEAAPDIVFHREAYDLAVGKVRTLFEQKAEWTTSEIRQELGMNRKYVVPLVETFDRLGLTVRVGDKRKRV